MPSLSESLPEETAPVAPEAASLGDSEVKRYQRKRASVDGPGGAATSSTALPKPRAVKRKPTSVSPGAEPADASPAPAEVDASSLPLINRNAIKKTLKNEYPNLRASPDFYLAFSKEHQKHLRAAADRALAEGRRTLSAQDARC